MASKKQHAAQLEDLRPLAEEILKRKLPEGELGPKDMERLLHELKVYQIELEMQNEELQTAQRRLEASHHKYFKLFETAPVGYLVTDANGVVREANRTMRRMLGKQREGLAGKHVSLFLCGDSRKEFLQHVSRILSHGSRESVEANFRGPKDGCVIANVESGVTTDFKSGEAMCLSAVMDLTDSRTAARELARAHQVLKSHVMNTPLAVVEWDSSFRVLRWSGNAEKIFGWTEAEVKNMHPEDWRFVHEGDREEVNQVMRGLLSGRERSNVSRNRNYTRDGRVLHCEWYNSAVFDADGNLESLLSLVQDETESVKNLEALQKSEQRLQQVVDNAPMIIWGIDEQGVFNFYSGRNLEQYALSAEMHVGRSLFDIYAEHEVIVDSASRALRGEVVIEPVTFKDAVFETRYAPVYEKDGEQNGAIGVALDVTERVRAESALKLSEERLNQVVQSAPIVIWTLDKEGRFTFLSGNGLSGLGMSPEQYLGRSVFNAFAGNEQAVTDANRALAGESFSSKCEHAGMVFETRLAPLMDGRGRVEGCLGVAVDVTERERAVQALRESELRYRAVFENSIDGISVYEWKRDRSGRRLVDCNQAYADMAGRSKDELLQSGRVNAFQREHDSPYGRDEIRRRIEAGEPYNGTFSWLRPDGLENYVEYHAAPVETDGRVLVFGIDRDVTKRVKQERAMQESESRFRAVFENAAVGVFLLNMDGSYLQVNREFARMHGFSGASILGKHYEELVHPDDLERNKSRMEELLDGRTDSYSIEKRHRTKSGEDIDVRVAVSGLRGEDRTIRFLVGIVEDVSDRKDAERELTAYREKLERMVEDRTRELEEALKYAEGARDRMDVILKSVGDGLVVSDLHNRIVLMNRKAEEILGVRFSEAVGMKLDYAIDESTFKEQLSDTIARARANASYQFDFGRDDEAGKRRRYRARTSVVQDRFGRQTGVVTIMHDVTREREVDRMKSEFISTAAHELRTPMTSVQGFSEILLRRDDLDEEERERFLKHINRNATALSGIISDLLDISRIESGRGLSLTREVMDVVAALVRKLESLAVQQPEMEYELDAPEDPVKALADPNKVEQVLENLLSNAVKYSPDGVRIEAGVKVSDGEVLVCISDRGLGMTAAQVDRVFEKFHRGHAADSGIPGTGLGMSIVRYIVEAHGGGIEVLSEPDKGTTVTFSLPAYRGETEVAAQPAAEAGES
jgi:PAS domain S-box-containing protein